MSPQQIHNRLEKPQKQKGPQNHKAQRAQILWSLAVALAVALVAIQQVLNTQHESPGAARKVAAVSTLPGEQRFDQASSLGFTPTDNSVTQLAQP